MASTRRPQTPSSRPSGKLLRASSSTRPALWRLSRRGVDFVVKDYRFNGFLFRNTVGRFLVWREAKAYRRLDRLEGIPRFIGRVEGLVLVMEAAPARPVEGLEHDQPLPVSFFDGLRELVNGFHARGVAHCDLKRAPNILVGEGGEPWVVDWSAAITRSEFRPFPLSLVYRRFLTDDLDAVVKLQLRHCPGDVPPHELERYRRRGPLERGVRRVRDRARSLLQRLA